MTECPCMASLPTSSSWQLPYRILPQYKQHLVNIPSFARNSPATGIRHGTACGRQIIGVTAATSASSSSTTESTELLDEQILFEDQAGILCDPCEGKGWLVCDFCRGEKTNVKASNNRIYRRCPNCRAVGFILCPLCKVYKCITFPSASDIPV